MTEFTIRDADFANLRNTVAVITGCSSGIGLATTKLLLQTGAFVIGGDLNPAPLEKDRFTFVKTSVTSWDELSALFRRAKEIHGRIDHVFANAGITGQTNYLDDALDERGNLLEPKHTVHEVMLRGAINTCTLAFHYMRRQETGGSVVVTASASAFQRFRAVDYATAKHGVLGFVRGMTLNLSTQKLPIRINAIAPSWTVTGIVPAGLIEATGKGTQSAEVPARSTVLLMADPSRHGQVIYSEEGKFKEIESVLLKGADEVLGDGVSDELVMTRLYAMAAASAKKS